jgi:hypothetical protein
MLALRGDFAAHEEPRRINQVLTRADEISRVVWVELIQVRESVCTEGQERQ